MIGTKNVFFYNRVSVFCDRKYQFPFRSGLTAFGGICSDSVIHNRCYSGPETDAGMTNTF